jgi:hypothetical protein
LEGCGNRLMIKRKLYQAATNLRFCWATPDYKSSAVPPTAVIFLCPKRIRLFAHFNARNAGRIRTKFRIHLMPSAATLNQYCLVKTSETKRTSDVGATLLPM